VAGLFGRNKLREFARASVVPDLDQKIALVDTWRADYHHGSLRADKETSREQAYNQDFFIKILGYAEKPASPYSFEPKATTAFRQLPDAVLSHTDVSAGISSIAAVVELKGASVALDRPQQREGNLSPVQQAFKYKTQYRVCPFVIVSNFYEFRLYADNQLDYERWTLDDLVDHADDYLKFRSFHALLCRVNLTAPRGTSRTEDLLSDIRTEQDEIGKKFYSVYKLARLDLLRDIYRNNPGLRDSFQVGIEKAQKIVDRVVFACFAEDRGLLPDDTVARVIAETDRSSFGSSLWATFKAFFEALDRGSDKLGIPLGYNGGLFAHDPVLNDLTISDSALRAVAELSRHDFVEELSVKILGHIFEQSISDLEEIKDKTASARGLQELDKAERAVGKRKKEGVYYTPDFIIRYIIDNTLGAYLRAKEDLLKEKHRLTESILDVNYQKRERAAYLQYQTVLQDVTVCDPACGSGAFLVSAFDYLLAENRRVDDILGGSLMSTDEYVRSILKNNLFGVDLNEESVQITKLSLWLKTAEKGKKLTTLDENIRSGNSLVAGPEVGIKGSFDWKASFPQVFSRGGFDVIVGNPPYVRVQNLDHAFTDYLFKTYHSPVGKVDISIVFFEKAIQLVQPEGLMAFISSSQWMQTDYGRKLRSLLAGGYLREILDFGSLPVFEDASTYPAIFTLSKKSASDVVYGRVRSRQEFSDSSLRGISKSTVSLAQLGARPWQFGKLNLVDTLQSRGIQVVPLTHAATAYYGNVTGLDAAFVLSVAEANEAKLEGELLYPYALRGGEITRFANVQPDNVVIFPYVEGEDGSCIID
jgi:Eco57I restriction-modification methylase